MSGNKISTIDRTALSPRLKRLLEILNQQSEAMPATLQKDWFSAELFQCRSEKTCDYLQEIQDNLQKLYSQDTSSSSHRWLLQHVNDQLNAFTQAVFRSNRPKGDHRVSLKEQKTGTLAYLHQELAKHHDYERRLSDNLRVAQTNNPPFQQQIILCQQRLLKCQRAIVAIERRIANAEE